jgi:hypothetical protein
MTSGVLDRSVGEGGEEADGGEVRDVLHGRLLSWVCFDDRSGCTPFLARDCAPIPHFFTDDGETT